MKENLQGTNSGLLVIANQYDKFSMVLCVFKNPQFFAFIINISFSSFSINMYTPCDPDLISYYV